MLSPAAASCFLITPSTCLQISMDSFFSHSDSRITSVFLDGESRFNCSSKSAAEVQKNTRIGFKYFFGRNQKLKNVKWWKLILGMVLGGMAASPYTAPHGLKAEFTVCCVCSGVF